MKKGIKLHALHAKGKFYVDDDTCLACDTCDYYAPDNFKYDTRQHHLTFQSNLDGR